MVNIQHLTIVERIGCVAQQFAGVTSRTARNGDRVYYHNHYFGG